MLEDNITLWAHHVSSDFPNGQSTEGLQSFIQIGSLLQKDFGIVIDYCEKIGGEWSISKIECWPNDVKNVQGLKKGWMQPFRVIYSEDGYMPLEEVKKIYEDHIKYA